MNRSEFRPQGFGASKTLNLKLLQAAALCGSLVLSTNAHSVEIGRRAALTASACAAFSGLFPLRFGGSAAAGAACAPEASAERSALLIQRATNSAWRYETLSYTTLRRLPNRLPGLFPFFRRDLPLFADWDHVLDEINQETSADPAGALLQHGIELPWSDFNEHWYAKYMIVDRIASERIAAELGRIEIKLAHAFGIPLAHVQDEVDFIFEARYFAYLRLQDDGTIVFKSDDRIRRPLGREFLLRYLDELDVNLPDVANYYFSFFQFHGNGSSLTDRWHVWDVSPQRKRFLEQNYRINVEGPGDGVEESYRDYKLRIQNRKNAGTKQVLSQTRRSLFSLPKIRPSQAPGENLDCADFFSATAAEAPLQIAAPPPKDPFSFEVFTELEPAARDRP